MLNDRHVLEPVPLISNPDPAEPETRPNGVRRSIAVAKAKMPIEFQSPPIRSGMSVEKHLGYLSVEFVALRDGGRISSTLLPFGRHKQPDATSQAEYHL